MARLEETPTACCSWPAGRQLHVRTNLNIDGGKRWARAEHARPAGLMEGLIAHGVEYLRQPRHHRGPILDALLDTPAPLHRSPARGRGPRGRGAYAQTAASLRSSTCTWRRAWARPRHALQRLQGARRCSSAGQQDTRLRCAGRRSATLVAMAAPLTKWSVQVERVDEFALIIHRVKIATDPPGGTGLRRAADRRSRGTDLAPFAPPPLRLRFDPQV